MAKRLTTAQPIMAMRRWGPLALVTAVSMGALIALTAGATARQGKPAGPAETVAPREAGEPIMAIVSIKTQHVTLYDADGWIYRAPVSTGTTGRETPAGVFAVVEKDKDHRSTMYDDAEMPNMQRITWNGIALHGGPLPGYAASHGCVRMPFGFAEKLFDKTRIGMRVIISPNDAAPVEISHPVLLQPKAEAIAAAPARAETLVREAAEAIKAADEAKKLAATTAREAAALTASLRKLEQAKKNADAELAYADKVLANAKTDQAKAQAEERKQKAAAKAEEAGKQLDTAKADTKVAAAAAAKDALKAAEKKKADLARAALDAKLAVEPVSIYISRATNKLYVRRNTHKPAPDGGGEVFDTSIEVPVTIRDSGKKIGTHIFTAMAKSDAGLRWSVVSIDGGDDAKNALDRVTIPQEVLDRIGPTALPRSSIVISDEPLSKETNYRTEFVTVLSDQPQGGFITRKPTPTYVAEGSTWGGEGGFGFFWQPQPPPQANPRQRGGGQPYYGGSYYQGQGYPVQQPPGYRRW
ncbi:MAG: L,D-transpeptidase [Bradyrhizobium icense]|nr:MAG: L,D-transpeptidase [Bradyrhizobium icense]